MCTLFPSACSMALQTVVVRGSEDAVEDALEFMHILQTANFATVV